MRFSLSYLTLMYYDNQISIQITHNLIFHERTKHIEINYHLTRYHLKHDTITLPFVPSSLQIASLYQVVFYFSLFFSSWQTLDIYSCRNVSLRGDVKNYRVILFYCLLRV
jgi:hypothetical protein